MTRNNWHLRVRVRDGKCPTLCWTVPHNHLSSPKYSSGPSTLRNTSWTPSTWEDNEWGIQFLPAPKTNFIHGTWKDKYKGTLLPVAVSAFREPIVTVGVTTPSSSLSGGSQISYQNLLRSTLKVQISMLHTWRLSFWSFIAEPRNQSWFHR